MPPLGRGRLRPHEVEERLRRESRETEGGCEGLCGCRVDWWEEGR